MRRWGPGPLLFLALIALLACAPLSARARALDDSDLSGGARPSRRSLSGELSRDGASLFFKAQPLPGGRREKPGSSRAVLGRLLLAGPRGEERPGAAATVFLAAGARVLASVETAASGEFVLPIPAGFEGPAAVRFRLENPRWSLQAPRGGKAYEWGAAALSIPPQGPVLLGDFRPDPATENGRIAFIHLQFLEAFGLFEREGLPLGWWKRTLRVNYPGSSDFFSPGASAWTSPGPRPGT